MALSLQQDLTEAVFRSALEPAAWGDVMRLMNRRFPSEAQTFYILYLHPRRVRPLNLEGVAPRRVASIEASYFTPDNPWVRLTRYLHRPGVVRTNERLERLLRDPGVLYRSSYYNDWMRPQGFKTTIGNTLLADDDMVANITLLRAPDRPTFNGAEVRAFEQVSRHMTRALQVALRIERAEAGAATAQALDAVPQALAFVDAQLRLGHANAAMERLLRAGRGLRLREGMLWASAAAAQPRLVAGVARALAAGSGEALDVAPIVLPGDGAAGLVLHALPVRSAATHYLPAAPTVMLMVAGGPSPHCPPAEELRQRYGLTPAEARLSAHMVQGLTLQAAAQACGVTYGTARTCLKAVFGKAGVHSQAQLVARVLRDAAGRWPGDTDASALQQARPR